jgi:hypothetical protein
MKKFSVLLPLLAALAFSTVAFSYGKFCSTDGTVLMQTGESSIRSDGSLWYKYKCTNYEKQHTRWYKS